MRKKETEEIKRLLNDICDHINLIEEDISYLRDKYDLY
jgi:hypothetical protein